MSRESRWNGCYSTISLVQCLQLKNIPSLDCEVELMADITIKAAEVQKKLQDPRTDKAPGANLIHPRLLKELVVHVVYPLAIIFQQSTDQTRVPQQWKTANVIPIFKVQEKEPARCRQLPTNQSDVAYWQGT